MSAPTEEDKLVELPEGSPEEQAQQKERGLNVQQQWFEEHFYNREWQDVCFLVFNYLWSFAVFGLIIAASINKSTIVMESHSARSKNFDIIGIALGVSLTWGFVFVTLVRYCARLVAWLTAIGVCSSTGVLVGVCVYYAVTLVEIWAIVCSWLGAVVTIGLLVSQIVFLTCYWKKVEITCLLWEMASESTLSNWGVVFVTLIVVVGHLCVLAFLLWGCVVISWWEGLEWTMVFPIITITWNYWVTIALMRTSVGGSVASWYYGEGNRAIQGTCPALQSLWRAGTKSFGAVSLGAMLLSFLSIFLSAINRLQNMIDSRKDGEANCCFMCCLKSCLCNLKLYCFCMLGALEWMSEYAYCYVALFGVGFMEGGRMAVKLIKQHGILAIVSEGFTYWMGLVGALLGFAFSVCAVWVFLYQQGREWDYLYVFFSFFTAAIVSYLWTLILDCSVDSVLVCFVCDLEQFAKSNHLFARKTFVKQLEGLGWKGSVASNDCRI